MMGIALCKQCAKELLHTIGDTYYEVRGAHVGPPCATCHQLQNTEHTDRFCSWGCLKLWMASEPGWHS